MAFALHCSGAERFANFLPNFPQPKAWPPELSSVHTFFSCFPGNSDWKSCACQLAGHPPLCFCHTYDEVHTCIERQGEAHYLLSEMQALIFSCVLEGVKGCKGCTHPSTAQSPVSKVSRHFWGDLKSIAQRHQHWALQPQRNSSPVKN